MLFTNPEFGPPVQLVVSLACPVYHGPGFAGARDPETRGIQPLAGEILFHRLRAVQAELIVVIIGAMKVRMPDDLEADIAMAFKEFRERVKIGIGLRFYCGFVEIKQNGPGLEIRLLGENECRIQVKEAFTAPPVRGDEIALVSP